MAAPDYPPPPVCKTGLPAPGLPFLAPPVCKTGLSAPGLPFPGLGTPLAGRKARESCQSGLGTPFAGRETAAAPQEVSVRFAHSIPPTVSIVIAAR